METPLQRLLARCGEATLQANGWYRARCPAHDDRVASFGFRECEDGHLSVVCQAGCARQEILRALGLTWQDLYPTREEDSRIAMPMRPGAGGDASNGAPRFGSPAPAGAGAASNVPAGTSHGRIVATYPYRSSDGTLLYEVVRFDPKAFRPRRPDPDREGAWLWNLQGVGRVLYRLPEVLAAVKAGERVYLVEGEKDAEKLVAAGVCATTNAGGANKWEKGYSEALAGAEVVVLPDNDEAGKRHIDRVAWALRGQARSVRVVELPGLPEHGDVTDWLAGGGTVEELGRLVEAAPPGRFQLSDAGNAERLVGRHGQDFRYLRYGTKTGDWLVWDGQRWALDVRGEMTRRALETVRSMYAEAAREGEDERRKRLVGHALDSEDRRDLMAMVALAADLGGVSCLPEEFDADPWRLNCPNGTVDLRTGELRPHRREDLCLRICRVACDLKGAAPRWERFLREVFQGDEGLVAYVERVLGYALTGRTTEREMWIAWGGGRNGKGTLLEAVGEILGGYAAFVRADVLMWDDRKHGDPVDFAEVPGARYVWAEETNEGRRLDEARVKGMTGGNDTLRARRLYKEEYSFKPQFKLFMATNSKPVIRGTDEGIWDRVRLLPFLQRFSDKPEELAEGALPIERGLYDALRGEYPVILGRLVRGCLDWQANGLQPPAAVVAATAEYREEQDLLGGFLQECCVVGQGLVATAKELYGCYSAWAERNGEKSVTQRTFGTHLSKRKFTRERTRLGYRWLGLSVRDGLSDTEERDGEEEHEWK